MQKIIRGYELRDRVGIGGFGEVYRAYQAVVNREVAIKIILPQYVNHPDFIRRFEAEAQLIARLEHPHIVPLYDFWREPDGAYLVMRWLRGGNLRSRLIGSGFDLETTARLLDQMAAALMVAHRNNVIHRDIKPDNILLDEEGNAYLTDFGIAKDITGDSRETMILGSPPYLSPEQITGAAVSPASDIYSLGIVLYEILTGVLPFSKSTTAEIMGQHIYDPIPSIHFKRADLPVMLNTVIWRATAKDPSARYPDALSFAADFRKVAFQATETTPVMNNAPVNMAGDQATNVLNSNTRVFEPANPYKGLRAFDEADERDFFGRESLVEDLIRRFNEPDKALRFLAVVGPSGSGKSSVVKAGLLPAIRRGSLRHSEDWFVVTMVPGSNPIEELAASLRRLAMDAALPLLDLLRSDEAGLAWVVPQLLPDDNRELLLVIDQFEEVFTLTEDEAERTLFLDSLQAAVLAPNSRLRVIVTLRADFYDRPLFYPGFGDLIRQYTEVVLPLAPAELERAIVGPAKRLGLMIETGLIAAMVADVSEQPGALPLLQYTLTEVFERRNGNTLTLSAYRELGGVSGALARRAEELYAGLNESGQRAARQIFLRLVAVGEETETTRRRALWSEVIGNETERQASQPVLELFGKYRLLTFDREPTTRMPTVEVAHEALIRAWERLQEWIENSREALRMQRRLTLATQEWLNSGCEASFLATGARLEQFEALLASSDLGLNDEDIRYIQASAVLRQAARNRLRAFIAVLIVFSIVSLSLAAFAFDRQNQAVFQERTARSRELAAVALSSQNHLDRGLLLSLAALQTADTFEARNSLLTSLQNAGPLNAFLFGHTDAARSLAFSPDGKLLASGSRDNTIRLWEIETRQALVLTGHTDWINSVAFSPDGKMLASGSKDGTIRRWDAATGQPVGQPLVGHEDAVWSVAFSPDGKLLASASADNTVRLWDAATGNLLMEPLTGHDDIVYSVVFSPDGQMVVSGSADGTIRRWDAHTGQPIGEPLAGHTNWVLCLVFSPDGRWLASSGADQQILLWDMGTGRLSETIATDHTDWIRSLDFSPDGVLLASGSADGTIHLWDVATGQPVGSPLAQPGEAVWSVAFSPNGQLLASASADSSVILWQLGQQLPARTIFARETEAVADVAMSRDGKTLAVANGDATGTENTQALRLWDVQQRHEVVTLEGHQGPVTAVMFDPTGNRLVSASADRTIRLWDATTYQPIGQPLTGHTDVVWDVAFSPDGKALVSGSDDNTVRLWEFAASKIVEQVLTGHSSGVLSVVFSPDGRHLASADRDSRILLWNWATGEMVGPLSGHTDVVMSLAFSPDGQTLASASRDMTIILWNLATLQPLKTLNAHTDWVTSVAFSPDGQMLASGSRDSTVILWDVIVGQPIGQPLTTETDWVTSVAFSPDGQTLIAGSRDGTVTTWEVGLERWERVACTIANRDFSEAERDQYFPGVAKPSVCMVMP